MENTNELTGLEMIVLAAIPKECFYENGFDSTPWMDCFLETVKSYFQIDPKQTRAVMVSLQKKQYISIHGEKSDKFFELEEKGKEYLKSMNLVDANGKPIKG